MAMAHRSFSMMSETIAIRRSRVRDLTDRFASKVILLFTRRTQEVGTLLPELYRHGLSTGDFELAQGGLLGESVSLSTSASQRLKARFEREDETWAKQDLADLEVLLEGRWRVRDGGYRRSHERSPRLSATSARVRRSSWPA